MLIYRTERKLYLINELKSWLKTVVYAFLLFSVAYYFFDVPVERMKVGFGIVLLFKIGELVIEDNIKAIKIDSDNSQLAFKLNSIIFGETYKNYDLRAVKSEIVKPPKFAKWLCYGLTVDISLSRYKSYRINSRYGFSQMTLEEINASLNRINNP